MIFTAVVNDGKRPVIQINSDLESLQYDTCFSFFEGLDRFSEHPLITHGASEMKVTNH